MNNLFSFLSLPTEHLENIPEEKRGLYSTIFASLTYMPLVAAFNLTGFLIIYILSALGFLDATDSKILLFPSILLAIAIAQYPLIFQLEKRLSFTALVFILIETTSCATQIFFWQGFSSIIFIVTISAVAPFIYIILRGPSIFEKLLVIVYTTGIGIGVYYLNDLLTYPRVSPNALTSMASMLIYGTVILTLAILVLATTAAPFRSIGSRVIATFAFITTLSAVTTLLIGTLTSFFYDRQQAFEKIRTISQLKAERIDATLTDLQRDASTALNDPVIAQRIQYLLRGQKSSLLYKFNYDLVKSYLLKIQEQTNRYDEILLLDGTGRVILSTIRENEKQNFSNQPFFLNALMNQNYVIQTNYPGATGTSIIFVRPIGLYQGVLAARGKFDSIAKIVETQTGSSPSLETYLIGNSYTPLTKTLIAVDPSIQPSPYRTFATTQAINLRYNEGQGIYPNYNKDTVIGYYLWIPSLNAALITEIQQAEVLQGVLRLLGTNLTVGFFTTLMAFAIVFVTSRSISGPIVQLSEKAAILASGNFNAQIPVTRNDEIGQLAKSFNLMATELQGLVTDLESKVEERTKDLQKQANRLRLAAEVARDSITATNLDDLLNHASQLLQERFGFYHTAIYLVDTAKEFAILRASPTEAGKKMLANGYRLRIGQIGIIANVAYTGEPRISIDTGHDAAYLKNPLLPNTRSEIAIPLKINEQIIGVLDVQSDQLEAFTQDDIAVLQIMADQLALAIQRAQLLEQLETSLQEIERTYAEMTSNSWKDYIQSTTKPGYQFDGVTLSAIQSFPAETQDALNKGKTVVIAKGGGSQATLLATPLKLRGQVIGALNIKFLGSALGPDTIGLIEETANRLALALENARLYAETQKRAERDRLLGEISSRISTSFNIENIIRITAEEFGKILPEAEVVVEIEKNKE